MRHLLALSVAVVIASCDDVNVHILTGQQYDPTNNCVQGTSAGIDVVQGPATGDDCPATCLTATSGDSSFTYVTTVCPPYPGDYTVEAADAATSDADPCTGALAAYAAGTYCGAAASCGDGGDEGGDEGGCATAEGGEEGGGDAGGSGGDAGGSGGDAGAGGGDGASE